MFDFRKRITPKNAKFFLNLYPPFLFNRIRILNISQDFTEVNVKIKKSIFNENIVGTLFGGTMFSAADPFIAIMFWQIFKIRFHQKIIVWLKKAEIQYKKPASSDTFLYFKLNEDDILKAKKDIDEIGKHVSIYTVDLKNKKGEICAKVELSSYLGLP